MINIWQSQFKFVVGARACVRVLKNLFRVYKKSFMHNSQGSERFIGMKFLRAKSTCSSNQYLSN